MTRHSTELIFTAPEAGDGVLYTSVWFGCICSAMESPVPELITVLKLHLDKNEIFAIGGGCISILIG